MAEGPASLKSTATQTIIDNLGQLASSIECRFSCGGTVTDSTSNSVLISYKRQDGQWSTQPFQLPIDDTSTIDNLVTSCSIASFGIKDQTVIDKSYRDALKLDPTCFMTNFNLAGTCILNQINTLMAVTSPIRAELYKLNIYSTEGHFKTHVDTPRSKDMFGSLIVCLPSQFTGGQLVTSHSGRKVIFDWGNDKSNSVIQWGAFFSDVQHEVLPVTSGHRMTLTYNLYYSSPLQTPSCPFDVTINPFYKELAVALGNPHFMREGGVLGFYCQHKYVDISVPSTINFNLATCLKGEDAVIYQIATSLGLAVDMKPVLDVEYSDFDGVVAKSFKPEYYENEKDDDIWIALAEEYGGIHDSKHITWCHDKKTYKEYSGYTSQYGNAPTNVSNYQTGALLVVIPKFTSHRVSISAEKPLCYGVTVDEALKFHVSTMTWDDILAAVGEDTIEPEVKAVIDEFGIKCPLAVPDELFEEFFHSCNSIQDEEGEKKDVMLNKIREIFNKIKTEQYQS